MSVISPQDAHLREDCVQSEELLRGHFLRVLRDAVRLPNGQTASREYVVHPGAVVVIPLLDQANLVTVRQYRYPLGLVMRELPAGKLDAVEDPLHCGQRELREETGYSAAEWAYAGCMHLAVAYSTEIIHIYFARGLQQSAQKLDEGEFIDIETRPICDFLSDCDAGRISDAKTLTCAYYLLRWQAGHLALDWQAA